MLSTGPGMSTIVFILLSGWVLAQETIPVPPQAGLLQSSMTTGVTNLVIALATLLTAFGVYRVNLIAAKAKAKVDEASIAIIKKADEIGADTKTTLGHVNSAATELKGIIDGLRAENAQLKIDRAEMKQIAAVLAATHASQVPTVAAPVVAADEAIAKLGKIEVYTEDTAKNTAKTDATVTQLKKDDAAEGV